MTSDRRFATLTLSPIFLLVGLVSVYPMAYAIWVSLHSTRYLAVGRFIGLENFRAVLGDPTTAVAIVTTLKYVLASLAIAVPFAMVLALAINRPLRFASLFRTLVLLPWVLSQVVTALLWAWLLDPSYGPVNFLLREVGIGKVFFVGSPSTALPTLVWANAWMSYPLATVLFLAALQTVPPELYEAARIDGASAWRSFLEITIPTILPTVLVVVIMLTLLYFNMVTLILVLTGGGPLQLTEVMSLRAYFEAFSNFRVGHAAAVGVIILLGNVVFSAAYIGAIRRRAAA